MVRPNNPNKTPQPAADGVGGASPGRQGQPTVPQLLAAHPEINAIDEKAMASDRNWFRRHPRRRVRIRPLIDGEFLVDSVAGLYGQRPVIAAGPVDLADCTHVAVVDVSSIIGMRRHSDGSGIRVRFPVAPHPRHARREIEDLAWQRASRDFTLIRRHKVAPEAFINFPGGR